MKIPVERSSARRRVQRRGMVLVSMAWTTAVVLGGAVLAMDIGRMFVAESERCLVAGLRRIHMPENRSNRLNRRGLLKLCRGSVTVEFALIGTIFLVLLVGIADFGQFLFIQQAIVERAREAARWGAVSDPTNTAAIQNMVLYLQPTAPLNGHPSFGLDASKVAVSTADAGTDDYRLTVRISGYSYKVLSPFLAGSYTGQPVTVSVPLGQYN